jgi:hypothetical protein
VNDSRIALAPGMYPELPFEEYLSQPAVSASLLRSVITECPRAAWYESWLNTARAQNDNTKASDAGSIAHELLLEGSDNCVQVFDRADYPGARGGIPEGWTNLSIRQARDDCRAAGKIPVLKEQYTLIENMVDAARNFIESLKHSEPAIHALFQLDGGASEVSMIWDDDSTLCRIRPDRINETRTLVCDPKFTDTSVNPADWSRRQMTPMGYWLRAAFYRRGCRMMFGTDCEYIFLVVGQKSPHLCSLVGVDPAGFDHGSMQVERGLRTWRECVDKKWWPGYPGRVAYPEVKPWEQAEELERGGLTPDGIPYDYETMTGRKAA